MRLVPCTLPPATYLDLLRNFDLLGEDMQEVDFSDKPGLSPRAVCAAFRYVRSVHPELQHIRCTRAGNQVFLARNIPH